MAVTPIKTVTVRVESCLMADDGSHVLVNATLPDGTRVVNVELPVPADENALAYALLAHTGTKYHLALHFTGNISVNEPDTSGNDPAPAAAAIPAASVVAASTEDDAPKTVGVGDGAKSKTK